MIGQLRTVVLDCPSPPELASFYRSVLGGEILPGSDDAWTVLVDPDGRRLGFQLAPEYQPPRFPDPTGSQQFHLDVLVEDISVAEPAVLALGASFVLADDDGRYRVYTDPVGHTFCLIWL